ncbi:TetR/AcrR family transcriptional regulator [Microbacterium sp. CJ88]|uniref:TetR/AcrR family transcriptional regulator n=1 Tax=Microbacterium sp. CJ88 TaxID=3445672 RepID=UPI003F657281
MTTTTTPAVGVGRPRDPLVDASILRAALDLLVERGYAGMTMEGVARAAGTGKAAVYRRYASKSDLVVAAVRSLHGPIDAPDTGSLRGDLLACAMHYTRGDDRFAGIMAGLLTAAGQDAELRAVTTEMIGAPRAATFRTVIVRWIDAGVVPADVAVEAIVSIVPSVAFGRVVIAREVLDVAAATELVDDILIPALGGHRG